MPTKFELMTRDYSELRAKIPAERRALSNAKAQKIVAEMRIANPFPPQLGVISAALGSAGPQSPEVDPAPKESNIAGPKSRDRKEKSGEPVMSFCAAIRCSKLSVPVKSK